MKENTSTKYSSDLDISLHYEAMELFITYKVILDDETRLRCGIILLE